MRVSFRIDSDAKLPAVRHAHPTTRCLRSGWHALAYCGEAVLVELGHRAGINPLYGEARLSRIHQAKRT